MRIDSHAHLEPRMLDVDRVLAKMDAAGVDRVVLIPTMNDPLPKTPDRLLAAIRRLMRSAPGRIVAEGVHRATLTAEGNLKLSGEVFAIYDRPDNASVAQVLERHPDRFLGWIFLNPRSDPNVLDELERWRHQPGFVGVKLHPHWHDYRTDLLDPVLARAEELRLPVLVHLGFRGRGDYRAMAERFPRLTLIAAHAGFPFFDRLWSDSAHIKNLYVDLSSPYLDETIARAAVERMGPDRVLYGTDSPYGFHEEDGSYDYGHIAGWVDRLPVTDREKDRIFGENFLRLTLDRPGRVILAEPATPKEGRRPEL